MARRAAFLDPGRSLGEAVERVRLAESLGYESVWATQTIARDPLQVMARYATATTTIGLCTGVVPIMTRHPVQLAMEAATLDEIAGGRFSLGIGISHRLTVETMWGLTLDHPVERMEEYTTILRQIFAGGTGFEGAHYTARFAFGRLTPRADLPIFFAAMGPRMLRLATRLADGVVLWMCSPDHIRRTIRPTLEKELAEAGRSFERFDIVAPVPAAVTGDPASARAAFRAFALPYTQLPFYRKELDGAGFGDELASVDERTAAGDHEGALAGLSDRLVDAFAGIGDAATVRAKVEEYRSAGATLPTVGPIPSRGQAGSVEATLEAAAETSGP